MTRFVIYRVNTKYRGIYFAKYYGGGRGGIKVAAGGKRNKLLKTHL